MRRVRAIALGLAIAGTGVLGAACQRADPAPASSQQAGEATPDTLRDQVLAVIEQYYADFSARDWSSYAEHFWPGATLTTVWRPPGDPLPRVVVTTVDAFIEQAAQGPGSRSIFEERMRGVEVRAVGGLAQVWAHYSARFGDPGDVQEWSGIDAFTLIRHEGRWRIASLAYANQDEDER